LYFQVMPWRQELRVSFALPVTLLNGPIQLSFPWGRLSEPWFPSAGSVVFLAFARGWQPDFDDLDDLIDHLQLIAQICNDLFVSIDPSCNLDPVW
jgi:hypothetical protein